MMRQRRLLFIVCLVLVNAALFAALEWGASAVLDRFGLRADRTRIFNAQNGRDAGFVVQYDERLGYRLVRGNADPARFEDSAGRVVDLAKPDGVYRILCLGGSTTYGVGADKTNSYPAQLEDLLNRVYGRADLRFEVLNLGVMGYHSWHSRIRFKAELAGLSPDLVLVMDAVNDLVASTVADDSLAFVEEKDRLLRLTNAGEASGWLPAVERFLAGHSSLYALVKNLVRVARPAAEKQAAPTGDAVLRRRIEAFGYRDNMQALIALVRQDGADCALVDYPWLAAATAPAGAPKVLADASSDLYRFGRAYFPEANKAVAEQGGAAAINPQPAFDAVLAADPLRAGELYFDEIHLTKYGNQLLAREILAGLPQVPSFARAVAGHVPADLGATLANAVRLDDPRVHFANDWPRPGETPLSLAVAASDNLATDAAEYPGHARLAPADPARPAVIRLTAGTAFAPTPMAHTRYPAFWFPRVSCRTDRVEVRAGGRVVFALAGTPDCRFTGVAARFGVDLPALAPGDVVEVRLYGHAQLWQTGANLFYTGDSTPPGY